MRGLIAFKRVLYGQQAGANFEAELHPSSKKGTSSTDRLRGPACA